MINVFNKLKGTVLKERCFRRYVGNSLLLNNNYSKEQQSYILDKLNEDEGRNLPGKLVGEANASKIRGHLQKMGRSFQSLDEVLGVSGIGPKSLRKICEGLLQAKDGEEIKPEVKHKKNTKSFGYGISPVLTTEQLNTLQSVVTIHTSIGAVSWAHVDCDKKALSGWNIIEFDKELISKHLPSDLLQLACSIEGDVPEADLYVLEDPNSFVYQRNSDQGLKIKLAYMISAYLHALRKDKSQVIFMNGRLPGRHFGRVVGNEEVSLQDIIEKFASGQPMDSTYSSITIKSDLMDYLRSLSGILREALAKALLLAVTFIDLFKK